MKLVIFAASVLLAGCATSIEVAYHSDPPGATVYESGKPLGTAPIVARYAVDPAFKAGGCFKVRGTSARWASGAQAGIEFMTLCASQGYTQHYTFARPDVAGREIDMNYALQIQRNNIMREQANAAQTANTLQYLRTLNPPMPAIPMPIDCVSQRSGAVIRTECR
jgi:hypothetical protein